MEEKEYLRAPGLMVSSTRIEINGQTFATRNIGSVKITKPRTPWISSIFGAVFLITSFQNFSNTWFAALIGAALLAYAIQQVLTRRLVLVSGGGETVAYTSTKESAVQQLQQAIVQAISAR